MRGNLHARLQSVATVTATEFAEALRALIVEAEHDGLDRPKIIAALAAEVDEADLAVEAGPDGLVEVLDRLVTAADTGWLERAEVGAMLLDQIDAMREAEAE